MAVSYSPLTIEQLSEVCTIPPDSELGRATTLGQDRLTLQQLLGLLPNLAILDSSAKKASLTLAHFSVREYLTGSQLLSAHFGNQLRCAHRLAAKECLAYLYLSRQMIPQGALQEYAS
jgi:hypothetical protein